MDNEYFRERAEDWSKKLDIVYMLLDSLVGITEDVAKELGYVGQIIENDDIKGKITVILVSLTGIKRLLGISREKLDEVIREIESEVETLE